MTGCKKAPLHQRLRAIFIVQKFMALGNVHFLTFWRFFDSCTLLENLLPKFEILFPMCRTGALKLNKFSYAKNFTQSYCHQKVNVTFSFPFFETLILLENNFNRGNRFWEATVQLMLRP